MAAVRIVIVGRKLVGKSTAAKYLRERYGMSELTLSESLKQMLVLVYDIDPKYLYDQDYKEEVIPELEVTGRELMQKVGTELFRIGLPAQLPNIKLVGGGTWTHSLYRKKIRHLGKVENAIISDCRFQDEVDMFRDLGFKIARIKRDRNTESTSFDSHSSEQDQDEIKCDIEVNNNGTLEDLYKQLDDLAQ